MWSLKFDNRFASIAQLVEHLICNQVVGGSSPLAGSIHIVCVSMQVVKANGL